MFAILGAASSFAVDGVWTNTVTTSAQRWTNTSNWTDQAGAPVAAVPQAAGDTATLRAPEILENQTIYLGFADYALASLTGTAQHVVRYGGDRLPSYYNSNTANYNLSHVFALTDLTGFAGYLQPVEGGLTFRLSASTAIPALSCVARPGVEVPTAGTAATLANVYEGGALNKTGLGELVVQSTDGDGTTAFLQQGTLTLDPGSDTEMASLLARAAVRFDASVTNSYETGTDGDGRTTVTSWNNLNDNSHYAYAGTYAGSAPFLTSSRVPFLSAPKSPTGLPFVDFGARLPADVAEFGPQNCYLRFNKTVQKVRELFYAVSFSRDMRGCTPLGDNDTYDLIPDETYDRFVQFAGGDVKYRKTRNGDLTLNGRKVLDTYKPSTVTGVTVYSISPLEDVKISTLGTGCYRDTCTGGFRMGEVLAFTNVLTRAERARINAYLMRKWKGADRMLGTVIASASTQLGVAADTTAKVGEVVAKSGTLVKTGAGTLVVDGVTPASATVSVQGGSVRFAGRTAPAEAVAANPYIRLDARQIDAAGKLSFDGNPTNYVHSWKDCRTGVTTAAVGLYTQPPRIAYVVEDAVGAGKPAVSFGQREWGDHSHMKFPNWTSASIYAGFAVVRLNKWDSSDQYPVFGSSLLDTMRSKGRLSSLSYHRPLLDGLRWTIDGVPVDPRDEQALLKQNSQFCLIAFTTDTPVNCGGIAGERTTPIGQTYPDNCGGCQIAEMIVYDRKITEEERRETEAYLLKEWFGREHPAAAPATVAKMQYAAEAVVDTETALAVAGLETAGTTLVKRGSGAATVPLNASIKTYEIAGGTLNLPLDGEALIKSFGLNLHFDAMNYASLATSVSGTITNVTTWTDSVNQRVANSRANDASVAQGYLKHPTLQSVDMGAGLRPTVDFGAYVGVNNVFPEMSSASMSHPVVYVREVHEIIADTGTGVDRMSVLSYDSDLSWIRGLDGSIFDMVYNNTAADVRNGYIAIDGVQGNGASKIGQGHHLVSLAPLSDRRVNWMCNDRLCSFGGLRISEILAFPSELSAPQRAYVQGYLRNKWFGAPAPVWTNDFSDVTVSVAAGATFQCGSAVLKMTSLSGNGTIANDLVGIASVSASYDGTSAYLTVSGRVAFAETVTCTFDAGGNRLPPGEYPVLAAEGFDNLDLSKWTLNLNGTTRGPTALVRRDNFIIMNVAKNGFLLLYR